MTTRTDKRAGELFLSQWRHPDVPTWLASPEFEHNPAAQRALERLAQEPEFAAALPYLLTTLDSAAAPDRALINFDRFIRHSPNPPALLRQLARHPRALEILITLFAGSQFLTEILLRHPDYFDQLKHYKHLARPKNAEQFLQEAQAVLDEAVRRGGEDAEEFSSPPRLTAASSPSLDALRRFQRRELLRIGVSDLLGLSDVPTVTGQLSYLADSLVQACLVTAAESLNLPPENFTVIAMGKLGGEELNYSSDIDLLFLATENAAIHQTLGQKLIDFLVRVTGEGFLYRVDMRLRPWGRDGSLVSSVEGYLAYLARHAGLWEKQALLKARVIAGDRLLGQEFLRRAQPLIFETNGATVRAEVHALKQRIEARLRQRGQEWGEVKLGQGSIRDIEFVVQYLQLEHGQQQPHLRSHNTLDALSRLAGRHLLTSDEYRALVDGYVFLRTVEHHLQLMHYQQTHLLPTNDEALGHLARRLGFQGRAAGSHFAARYQQHSAVIRAVYQRHFEEERRSTMTNPPLPDVVPHLVRMHPSYAATFTDADIQRHTRLTEQLDDQHLVKVEAVPLDAQHWRVTIVGYDYLGELSLICGLLFVYGFDIVEGHVFTYDPPTGPAPALTRPRRRSGRRQSYSIKPAKGADNRKKIVDEFTVHAVAAERVAAPEFWSSYTAELESLIRRLAGGAQREAQGELARRVGDALRETVPAPHALYPIDIEFDNESSSHYTVLRIDAPDTIGFLYELTNALALYGINISRMTVETVGQQVRDTLYVADAHGQKITAPAKQHELRVATVLTKHFTHLLPRSPSPELALLHFREFLGQLFMRPDWPDELASLERPEVLDTLARLLGVSDFLWNDFLRMQHANLFPVVRDVGALAAAKTRDQLQVELDLALQAAGDGEAQRAALNAFKDREMFRIDMRQIQGHIAKFGQFSQELTDLAEVTVEAACRLCEAELRAQFGVPCREDGQPSSLSICALGKAGGRELGFASDIELMLIYAGNGQTSGPRRLTTAEFYDKLVQEVSGAVRARQEGVFELDLRLRPYGKAGSMAVSLDAFRRYFGPEGDAWPYERQALVKLRPIGGSADLGMEIIRLRDELIYSGQPFDVAAMRAMRERQVRHLVTAGTVNAKFSPGGLVDVEYLVQGLQITHGHANPGLRLTNTREAMRALADAGIIPPDDYDHLREAHIFLRRLINALRMVRGHAKDLTVSPPGSEEFAFLARRLDYGRRTEQLRDDLTRHMVCVQEISARLLG
ncbi:MAG: glutamine synthetase adenylyltransferase [Anaerolineae bacterium]|nr:ACT domain-containing protein [Anaerolineales bacterium]MCQ3977974.1 glutamine synthetase adenylyltransferase [Anaerolineae bacterium]